MDMVKQEKEGALFWYRRLRRAAALSRWLLEGLAALALLSWSSDRLPPALVLCAALLRRLPAILLHPASAFLLGNAIVVTLFAKSGGPSIGDSPSPPPPSPSAAGDASDHHRYYSYFSADPPQQLQPVEEEEVIIYEDKAVCMESTTPAAAAAFISAAVTSPTKGAQNGPFLPRTRSSTLPLALPNLGTAEKLLRRSETDVCARRSAPGRWWAEEEDDVGEEEGGGRRLAAAEDDNDQFRRRIEAFISKQMRFIEREEESLLLAAKAASPAVMVAAGGPEHPRR